MGPEPCRSRHTQTPSPSKQPRDADVRRRPTERRGKAIEAALREFEAGDHIAAFERLEPLRAGHPRVAETLAELRAKAVEVERGLESAEAVQQRSEEWVAEQLVAVRAAIDDERWDDAAAQVQELRAACTQDARSSTARRRD